MLPNELLAVEADDLGSRRTVDREDYQLPVGSATALDRGSAPLAVRSELPGQGMSVLGVRVDHLDIVAAGEDSGPDSPTYASGTEDRDPHQLLLCSRVVHRSCSARDFSTHGPCTTTRWGRRAGRPREAGFSPRAMIEDSLRAVGARPFAEARHRATSGVSS